MIAAKTSLVKLVVHPLNWSAWHSWNTSKCSNIPPPHGHADCAERIDGQRVLRAVEAGWLRPRKRSDRCPACTISSLGKAITLYYMAYEESMHILQSLFTQNTPDPLKQPKTSHHKHKMRSFLRSKKFLLLFKGLELLLMLIKTIKTICEIF